MYALQLRFITFVVLSLCLLQANNAIKVGLSTLQSKQQSQTLDDTTEKTSSVADQIALASTRFRGRSQYRPARANDYSSYGNLEMNLIRPDNDAPIRTEITAKYVSNIGKTPSQHFLEEDTETAEEYVAKAMNVYGSRLKAPIHIPAMDTGFYPLVNAQEQSYNQQTQQQQQTDVPYSTPQEQNQQQYGVATYQQDQTENQQHHSIPYPAQQDQQPQQKITYRPYQPENQQQEESDQKAQLEAQIQAQLQAQMQQAQQQLMDSPTEQGHSSPAATSNEMSSQQVSPSAVFEKDPVTRRYEVYDENAAASNENSAATQDDPIERQYRTKYMYKPLYRDQILEQEVERLAEEKIRVSASTEIPKAEIMKQIEKSVIKYMKELEAEGKIITAPQQETNTYYKVLSMPIEEKSISSTTLKPSYASSTISYHGNTAAQRESVQSLDAGSGSSSENPSGYSSSQRHQYHVPHKPSQTQTQSTHYRQTETQEAPAHRQHYGQQHQEMSDALAPNVEFIYKIKTHAPLQRATVKTVSKPYSLPLKSSASYGSQFDHSAALKNLEDFDLSHVVTTQEPDETQSVTGKPNNKLYFNSDVYQDINSLPYKGEKGRELPSLYRKVKATTGPGEASGEFKGYSGYFAEPLDKDEAGSGPSNNNDDGYPLMNPYKYVLKKEPLPANYEETTSTSLVWEQSRPHSKPHYSALKSQQPKDYENYAPKFNNNPEGYGYQHTYKSERDQHGSSGHNKYSGRHPNIKRGKRGGAGPGNQHSSSKKTIRVALKEHEPKLALRPPPKM